MVANLWKRMAQKDEQMAEKDRLVEDLKSRNVEVAKYLKLMDDPNGLDVPPGWTVELDDGKPFFWHGATAQSQLASPTGVPKPALAET